MARFTSFLILAVALLAVPASADAQGRGRGLGRFGVVPPPAARGAQQEPAFARGYADGFKHAQEDRKERKGYDPVAHRDYREGDPGFSRAYGSRDAYKNNYRAGFRAGYDAGYRDPTGQRR